MLRSYFFFFNDTATTEIYTLSLHDALPISRLGWENSPRLPRALRHRPSQTRRPCAHRRWASSPAVPQRDRKSTRLNSSHLGISYALFCLKKKNTPTSDSATLPTLKYSFSLD